MMKFFEDIMETLGMDANNFYSSLVGLVTALFPFVCSIVKSAKTKRENNLLDLHCKRDDDFFYPKILFVGLFIPILLMILLIGLHTVLMELGIENKWLDLVAYVIMVIFSVHFLLHRKSIRKRLLGKKNKKWLVYVPMIVFSVIMYTIYIGKNFALLNYISYVVIGVTECYAMKIFTSDYVQYEYASVKLHLNNGEVIDCADISKISRKHNSLVVRNKDKLLRVKYNDVSWVEYYGGLRIELIKK